MADIVQAQCGACRKRFGLRKDQLNRDVQCPHCRTVVRIAAKVDAPASAPADPLAALKQATSGAAGAPRGAAHGGHGGHGGQGAHGGDVPLRPAVGMRGGVRHKSVAIVWAVLIGMALIGGIVGLFVIFGRDEPPPATRGSGNPMGLPDVPPLTPLGPDGKPVSGQAATGAAAGSGTAPLAPDPSQEPLYVKVEHLLYGFADDSATYAVGFVKNNTADPIKALKVTVDLMDKEDNPLGKAEGVLLNIPPGARTPLVCEWRHEQGVRARKYYISDINPSPPGVPKDLQPLVCRDPWPRQDPNSVASNGIVTVSVTNLGNLPVQTLTVIGVLRDTQGEAIGAFRDSVTTRLDPNVPTEVKAHWTHCAGTLVNGVEVWAQPMF
jgi:DNA-directed RNA polymerase subunit RPC12/RpoP